MTSKIDTLIAECHSWSEFVELANRQTNTKAKGDLFERLTQLYLQTTPAYQAILKKVYWLQNDRVPEKTRHFINLPENDEGIDLICETKSGEFWSVQCRYKGNQARALTHKELSTFTSLSFNSCKNIKFGLVVHTSSKTVRKSHLLPNVTEIGLDKWLEISDDNWNRILELCRSNKLEPPVKLYPRPHQQKAIKDAKHYFLNESGERGKLIMPCGTGKSLTAYWIARSLKAQKIIVAVPSLSLIRQSLSDWTAQYLADGITPNWLVVCSDESVGSTADADSTVASVYETGIPTNPTDSEFRNFLTNSSKSPRIIFTTYQSAQKLCEASRNCGVVHDLLIADEAHKTVGHRLKGFATLLFDENITIRRRLFMTATERIYNASSDDITSMDNPEIYGSVIHHLSFKDAIQQEIICDYKIVTMSASLPEVEEIISNNKALRVTSGNQKIESDAQTIAAGLALQKAFSNYGVKHAITFHKSIKRARHFQWQQESLNVNSHISHSHISSKLPASKRSTLLKEFAMASHSVITNARCLTEGVDIKSVDCVAFIDPKQSVVDIVQAAGRAMRQSKDTGKKYGYIVVPILVEPGQSLDDLKASGKFDQVVKITTALSTQDERIAEELRLKTTTDRPLPGGIFEPDDELSDLIEMDAELLKSALSTVLWAQVGKANWRPFEEARKFVRALGLKSASEWNDYSKSGDRPPDIPGNPQRLYKNQGWKSFMDWLGTANKYWAEIDWASFEEAREYAIENNVKTRRDWTRLINEKPEDNKNFPVNVDTFYKNSGWIDWFHFTGREKKDFLSFAKARQFVTARGIKSEGEWRALPRDSDIFDFIPKAPNSYYQNKGWVSWPHFFSKPPVNYYDFSSARKKSRKFNCKSVAEWKRRTKSDPNFPRHPNSVYKDTGWQDWSDFLGVEILQKQKRVYIEFEQCRKLLKELGITTKKQFDEQKDLLPNNVPKAPQHIYADKGFKNWPHFLSQRDTDFLSYEDAKEAISKLKLKSVSEFRNLSKHKKLPNQIPSNPSQKYKDKGWVSWDVFLGK